MPGTIVLPLLLVLSMSGFILVKNKVYVLDFGLGTSSTRIEDKATDLHVLKEALEAKHFKFFKPLWNSILTAYGCSKNSRQVIKQLGKVELRGRYKAQY